MPVPIEAAPCRWVASLPDLQSMIHSLGSVEMLAVDVEHHHLHSYLGFVCLLQLSTGKTVITQHMKSVTPLLKSRKSLLPPDHLTNLACHASPAGLSWS